MTQEQFKAFWKQLKAPLKAQWDKLTDEDLIQIGGNMVKFNEVLDLRYGEQKRAVNTWANRRYSNWSGNLEGYQYPATSAEPHPEYGESAIPRKPESLIR